MKSKIEKHIYQIWVGDAKPPLKWMQTWKDKNPDWEYTLIDNEFVKNFNFKNKKHIDYYWERKIWHGVADLIRYEVLYEFGGFMPGADSTCLESIDDLFEDGMEAYACYENEKVRPGLVTPLYACTKGNEFAKLLIDGLYEKTEMGMPWQTTGNLYMQQMIEKYHPGTLKLLPSYTFNPVHYSGEAYKGDGKIYAVQHWGTTTNSYNEGRDIKLSVSMIVKNEEALLPNCLNSIKEADEIIIVDTGSKDKTKEIALTFTDKVYDFEWCDDFAKARNFALSKCTGEWVLSIDADEVLDKGGIKKVKELIGKTKKDAIGIEMKSSTYHFWVPRLFKKISDNMWNGRIHETLSYKEYENTQIGITFGTSPAHKFDPQRNLRMLEKAVEDNPKDARALYYLGREYGYYKEYEKVQETLEKYISLSTWLPERADAFFMLALAYWFDGKGNGEKARQNCLKAISINANFKAPLLLMAAMSFEKNAKQWRKMAETANNEDTLFTRENFNMF